MTTSRVEAVRAGLHHAEEILPGQKPIEAFVHHNTLHAFEDLPFERAVVEAGAVYGASPYMDEESFRAAWRSGRILERDLDDVLEQRFGDAPAPAPLAYGRAQDAVRDLMLYRRPAPPARFQAWLLSEGDVLSALPEEMARESRERLLRAGAPADVLPELWRLASTARSASAPAPRVRLRDRLVAAGVSDPDELAQPFLIRWFGAWLDQGVGTWGLPEGGGPLAALTSQWRVGSGSAWTRDLSRLLDRVLPAAPEAEQVVLGCLDRLGVADEDVEEYVFATLMALRGWAGMFVQMAARPDLLEHAPPATPLLEALALMLLVDEAAALHVRSASTPYLATAPSALPEDGHDPAPWRVFSACVALGVPPRELAALSAAQRNAFEDFLGQWTQVPRSELWQLAYERRYRVEILDSLVLHRPPKEAAPAAQVVCCIDDREESFRRALEEVSPRYQTFGYAGFYGLAMYFRALGEHHARPLCPASVVPQRVVVEEPLDANDPGWRGATVQSRTFGALVRSASIASHTMLRGGLSSLAGWSSAVPFVAQTLAPRLFEKVSTRASRPPTKLTLVADGRTDEATGLPLGFSLDEAADIVHSALITMGMSHFAPVVLVLGHGSRSMNNPHEAAHDCGACGGGRGGPNARGFAWFANQPEVRARLAERGLHIPDGTWFLGGYHNTCDDAVDVYDLADVPDALRGEVERLRADLDIARRLDALERCRRFESAPLDLSPEGALAHVEERAGDLSQPRPEYGHATNALCIVGRRSWNRGLFLDRRVFLTSYDPSLDDDGEVLASLLASVGPVGAGINLEYYFSFVDRRVYGSGTKLPHNITGLVGVMDGHGSDLRTGLPWQMVEIHEPVRLLVVIEGRPDRLDAVVAKRPGLVSLIKNRWILVAAFDPETSEAWFLESDGWAPHHLDDPFLPEAPSSRDWFGGHRGHLRPASITATAGAAP